MLVPVSTDAPIYHLPVVTLLTLAVNLGLFFAGITATHLDAEPYLLHLGEGLHPVQWFTSSFFNTGILRLLVDGLFVWTFGLVVEGKIGSLRFLPIYLVLVCVPAAVEQILFEGFGKQQFIAAPLGSCGPANLIFGLLGVSVIWAPKNEMNCMLLLGRPMMVEIAIMWLGVMFLLFEVLMAVLTNFWVLGFIAHVAAASLGIVLGLGMLKLDWVDCENWDLLAVIAGREGRAADEPSHVSEPQDEKALERQRVEAADHVRNLVRQQRLDGALAIYKKFKSMHADWTLPEADHLALIKAMHQQQAFSESLPLMAEFLRVHPQRSIRVRLKMAELLAVHEHRPRMALEVLSKIPAGSLPDDLEKFRAQLEKRARLLEQDGAIEVDQGEDW